MNYMSYDTLAGEICLVEKDGKLAGLYFSGGPPFANCPKMETPFLTKVRHELELYFTGKLKSFSIPFEAEGTAFRKRVWEELLKIPYGETITYGELAARIGKPKASRAVGGANHANPISIIIPCHRVIGAGGALTGYGGGLDNKKILLELEKKHA